MKKTIIILITLLFSNNVYAINICNDTGVLKTIRMIGILITVVKILVPVILILIGSYHLFKGIISNDENKIKIESKNLLTKLFIGATIFFIPTLFETIISLTQSYQETKNESFDCQICLIDTKGCDTLLSTINKQEEIEINNELAYIESIKKSHEAKEAVKLQEAINGLQQPSTTTESIMVGQKYNLSEKELRHIAYQCQREQGTPVGAAAEASLMANQWELQLGSAKKRKSLYDYVKNSGWYAHSQSNMSGNVPKLKDNILEAVRNVLINGTRTLPLYVNEHDCFNCNSARCSNGNKGDICSITTDGKSNSSMSYIKNRSNYVKEKSVIKNKAGGTWTFYTFPTKSSDPFGYTSAAYKKYQQLQN